MRRAVPVALAVASPARFARAQVALRLVLMIALAWFGITAGWLAWALYIVLPLVAAITVSTDGGDAYARDVAPRFVRALRWLLALSAYMLFLVDRFPSADDTAVTFEVRITARPTIGSALARLVTSLPSAFVLCLLSVVSGLLCVASVAIALVSTTLPAWLLAYQRGALRWQARLLAYHASIVDEYPPFSFETEDHELESRAASA